MKKKLLFFMLAVTMTISAAGCSKKEEPVAVNTESDVSSEDEVEAEEPEEEAEPEEDPSEEEIKAPMITNISIIRKYDEPVIRGWTVPTEGIISVTFYNPNKYHMIAFKDTSFSQTIFYSDEDNNYYANSSVDPLDYNIALLPNSECTYYYNSREDYNLKINELEFSPTSKFGMTTSNLDHEINQDAIITVKSTLQNPNADPNSYSAYYEYDNPKTRDTTSVTLYREFTAIEVSKNSQNDKLITSVSDASFEFKDNKWVLTNGEEAPLVYYDNNKTINWGGAKTDKLNVGLRIDITNNTENTLTGLYVTGLADSVEDFDIGGDIYKKTSVYDFRIEACDEKENPISIKPGDKETIYIYLYAATNGSYTYSYDEIRQDSITITPLYSKGKAYIE